MKIILPEIPKISEDDFLKFLKVHLFPQYIFHPFSLIDTVSLGVLATKQTVLARVCKELDISYDNDEAHSAAYDAEVTAQVFCKIINDYDSFIKN